MQGFQLKCTVDEEGEGTISIVVEGLKMVRPQWCGVDEPRRSTDTPSRFFQWEHLSGPNWTEENSPET